MNNEQRISKAIIALTVAGTVGLAGLGITSAVFSAPHAEAAGHSEAGAADSYAAKEALKTLNSFYKPALKGQFPGVVGQLTVGKSTRQDVINTIGEPSISRKHADDFDLYSANMGSPGYAISYKLNKIREIRYYGTNVERQTNIGGITMKMLKQNWYAPASTTTCNNGDSTQTKLTYHRGAYKLEFIFNSSTDLDHINLLKK